MAVADWEDGNPDEPGKERCHDVSRNGDDVPLDYRAREDGLCFPDTLNNVLERQERRGDFLDRIFNCPYEIQELGSHISRKFSRLCPKITGKYCSSPQSGCTAMRGRMRGQTDRNIRKVRNTALREIHKKILPVLRRREETGQPMTMEGRRFLAEMKGTDIDKDGGSSYTR